MPMDHAYEVRQSPIPVLSSPETLISYKSVPRQHQGIVLVATPERFLAQIYACNIRGANHGGELHPEVRW